MADGNGNGNVMFTNVRILDGTGEYPFTGEVPVQGNRIRSVTRGSSRAPSAGAGGQTVIDGMGATLMPGLCDAHLHLSWNNAPGIDPIQMMPPEEHILVTAEMAKLVLDAGFTSGRGRGGGQAAARRRDPQFHQSGPAARPALHGGGPEITTVGGLGDAAPSHIPHEGLNLGIVVSGPEEVRRTVRTADQIRRGQHQAEPVRRGDHRHAGRGDADVRGGGRDGGIRGAGAQQGARRPRPLRPDRSSNACGTASRTSTTPPTPTRRRSTCSRPPRTGISSRPASPG